MYIKKLEDSAEGRSIDLYDSYFIKEGILDEWEYVLGLLGIPEEDRENIFQISIRIDKLTIEDWGEDPEDVDAFGEPT